MHTGITLRQIETFCWIARLGSFSEAAAHLNATQPAISNRIRELETYLKVALFSRTGRPVRLTPAGRDLLGLAEQVVELGDEFLARSRSDQGLRGVIRIGAADTVALTWLPRLVAELSRRFPRLNVELFVDLSMNVLAKLMEGDLDIGFLVGSAPNPEFEVFPLGSVHNAWMCSPRFELAGRKVMPEELASFPILTHSRGSHLFQAVRQWFADAGVKRPRIHGCNSLATMIELTAAGLGVSVLPTKLVEQRHAKHRLTVIDVAAPIRPTRFSCIFASRPPATIYGTILELARREVELDPCFESPDIGPEAGH